MNALVRFALRSRMLIMGLLAGMLVAGGVAFYNPVSYTHLDVYKRQEREPVKFTRHASTIYPTLRYFGFQLKIFYPIWQILQFRTCGIASLSA